MSDVFWTYFALCATALLAGAMNSLAGGGTLLTFPALIAALTPLYGDDAAAVANATSTLALMPGSFAGSWGYRAEVVAAKGFVLRMLPLSFVGGLLGAMLVVHYPKEFGSLVPWLILASAVLFLIQPLFAKIVRRTANDTRPPGPGLAVGVMAFQFVVAVYGGYFGAGIGILMLAALGLMGIGSIHRMNGVKTVLASAINLASVFVFLYGGLIHWPFAGAMAAAAIVGGYGGARLARRMPAAVVRWVVIAIGFGLAAYYFSK